MKLDELEKKGKTITGLYNVKIYTKIMEIQLTTIYMNYNIIHGYNLPFRGWIHKDNFPKRFHPYHLDFLEDESPQCIDWLEELSIFFHELNFIYCYI